MIIYRDYNGKRTVERRNRAFGTRHGGSEARRATLFFTVAGLIFAVTGLLLMASAVLSRM